MLTLSLLRDLRSRETVRERNSNNGILTMGATKERRNMYKEKEIKNRKGEKKQSVVIVKSHRVFHSIFLSSLSISFVYSMFIYVFCCGSFVLSMMMGWW